MCLILRGHWKNDHHSKILKNTDSHYHISNYLSNVSDPEYHTEREVFF